MRTIFMRSTALAYEDELDPLPVSSQDVLETNIAPIRFDLNALKTGFLARIDRNHESVTAQFSEPGTAVHSMGANLNVLIWLAGGLVALPPQCQRSAWGLGGRQFCVLALASRGPARVRSGHASWLQRVLR